jgi:hypothetical protein
LPRYADCHGGARRRLSCQIEQKTVTGTHNTQFLRLVEALVPRLAAYVEVNSNRFPSSAQRLLVTQR